MVALSEIQRLTAAAITCEEDRSHESTWNEKVHWIMIQAALASSAHAEYLNTASAYVHCSRPTSSCARELTRGLARRLPSIRRALLAKHCPKELWTMSSSLFPMRWPPAHGRSYGLCQGQGSRVGIIPPPMTSGPTPSRLASKPKPRTNPGPMVKPNLLSGPRRSTNDSRCCKNPAKAKAISESLLCPYWLSKATIGICWLSHASRWQTTRTALKRSSGRKLILAAHATASTPTNSLRSCML